MKNLKRETQRTKGNRERKKKRSIRNDVSKERKAKDRFSFEFQVECRREHRQIDEAEIRKIVESTTRKRDKRRSKKADENALERNTASPGSNPGMTPPPQVMSTGQPTQQGGFPPRFPYPRPPGMPGQVILKSSSLESLFPCQRTSFSIKISKKCRKTRVVSQVCSSLFLT